MQRISFTTLSTPGLSIRAVARLARACGYDGVDIRVSRKAGELTLDSKNAEIGAVQKVLAEEDVLPAGLLGYLAYDDLPFGEVVESLRSQLKRLLAIADEVGALSVRITGLKGPERSFAPELEEALGLVLGQANTDIVIQNHAEAFSAVECLAMAARLDHPRFSLAFSPDHSLVMGEDFATLLPQLAGKVRKLFIADLKQTDGKFETVLPGCGAVPFRQSYAALNRDFNGWITFKYERFWEPSLLAPEASLSYFIQHAPQWFEGWEARA